MISAVTQAWVDEALERRPISTIPRGSLIAMIGNAKAAAGKPRPAAIKLAPPEFNLLACTHIHGLQLVLDPEREPGMFELCATVPLS